MNTDQQRLILMIKKTHESGKGPYAPENRNRPKKRAETQLKRMEKPIDLT